jgi:hypothetical protein
MSTTPRSSAVFSMDDAVGAAPVLAQLRDRVALSERCLSHVLPIIPSALRPHVKAGPIEGDQWCLLVGGAAASSKLRQLLPAIQAALSNHGIEMTTIRIKVQTTSR